MKTKLQIINETAEFYQNNPRSLNPEGGACMYTNQDGCHCALGRYMTDQALSKIADLGLQGRGAQSLAVYCGYENLDDMLVAEVRGHSLAFWGSLQDFHDESAYWKEQSLTESGQKALKRLREQWGNEDA